jgi:pyruvate dehydrogenase E1 component alpha subunit
MTVKTTTVANFNIHHLQFLDENSHPTQPFPDFATNDYLLLLYRQMSLVRAIDNKAVNLQRTGKMGTYPSSRGQEAVSVGMGASLDKKDVFVPYYRDQGTFLMRGSRLSEFFAYWGGDERGCDYSNPDAKEDFPNCVPIASQLLHAAGIAYALKYRKQPRAVLSICGDGGTSEGDFYETINVAGAWKLPIVLIINNNQWAISVARSVQTGCQTLAQKAIAGGFEGLQVDGNDVIAVRYAVTEALQKARNGGGPTLIEAVTYRLADHTTADDAKRYVPADAMKTAWETEPIARLGYYLEAQGLWSKEKEAELQKELADEVDKVVEEYLNAPPQKPTAIFDYLYAKLPHALQSQYDEVAGVK